MAPVGSIRALYAAIASGADAVYLGLDCFNARAKAQDFTVQNIDGYIDLCHLYGVKVYIAFNTAVKEKELAELDRYVSACTRADAFIIADLGALDVFYQYDVPLHASTQMGVNNLEGALFLQKKGFSRVVVARETAKEDIIAIKKKTSLELEYFVHGALCVSYSGSCLLSSMMSGDSGNRGRCNQPCRLPYRSDISGREGYLLSPSDQCLITKLGDLENLGVDSLKIEGRLKQPHYVASVVSQYRAVLNGAKADNFRVSELKKAFNRGEFTCGYVYDDTKEIMSPKVQSNIGLSVGTVVSSDKRGITVRSDSELRDGDGLKLLCKGKEIGGFAVKILKKDKNVYLLAAKGDYPKGTEVRKTLDVRDAEEEVLPEKLKISVKVCVSEDYKVTATAQKGEVSVSATGYAAKAVTSPLSEEDLRQAFSKLGDTPYTCLDFSAELEVKDLFMPRSSLNSLRREVVERLTKDLLAAYSGTMTRCDYSNLKNISASLESHSDRQIIVNTDDFEVIKRLKGEKIAISYQIYEFSQFISYIDIFLGLIENTFCVYLHLPPVVRGSEMRIVEEVLEKCKGRIDGIICENYYTLTLAEKYGFKTVAGIRLNAFNSRFAKHAGVDGFICSPELTLREIDDMNSECYVYAYGILPVMTFCHCPVQVSSGKGCEDCAYRGDFYYHDKKADYLIKRTRIKRCYFEMHNASVVDISSKADKIRYNLYVNMVNCKRDPLEVVRSVTVGGQSEAGSNCAHLFRGVK